MTKRLTLLTLMLVLLISITGSALADDSENPPPHPVTSFLASLITPETDSEDDQVDYADAYATLTELRAEYGLGNVARALQYVLASQLAAEESSESTPLTLKGVLELRAQWGWGRLYNEGLLPYHPGGRGLGSLIGGQRGLALGHRKHDDAGPTDESEPAVEPPAGPPVTHPVWGEGGDGPPGPPSHVQGPNGDNGPGNGNGLGHSNGQGNGHSNGNGRGHTENSNSAEGSE